MIIPAKVDFSKKVRKWDGFGVNYVETCQTYDPKNPQDYGGFSTLSENQKKEIEELIFGENGLKPSILKMFLDPLHQLKEPMDIAQSPEEAVVDMSLYNHSEVTANMMEFVKAGLSIMQKRGDTLKIYSSLYGPPRWMTKQKVWRGRDLDEKYRIELCRYITSWVKFLKNEGLPVLYMGLHNEGEDFYRWNDLGLTRETEPGHDYNLYWTPEMVTKTLPLLKKVLEANGIKDVTPTNGETTNWGRFSDWGYADAIKNDKDAIEALGLITSHGFFNGDFPAPYFGDHRSEGIDSLRELKPELHAWSTSTSWSKMDAAFLLELKNQIYSAKVNGIIPWACIQNHSLWTDGDPNPGCAILVDGNGNYSIEKGYWYYKQVCRIGQANSDVVSTSIANTSMGIIAFEKENQKSFCIISAEKENKTISVDVNGIEDIKSITITRTTPDEQSKNLSINDFRIKKTNVGISLEYDVPSDSATTFEIS